MGKNQDSALSKFILNTEIYPNNRRDFIGDATSDVFDCSVETISVCNGKGIKYFTGGRNHMFWSIYSVVCGVGASNI